MSFLLYCKHETYETILLPRSEGLPPKRGISGQRLARHLHVQGERRAIWANYDQPGQPSPVLRARIPGREQIPWNQKMAHEKQDRSVHRVRSLSRFTFVSAFHAVLEMYYK